MAKTTTGTTGSGTTRKSTTRKSTGTKKAATAKTATRKAPARSKKVVDATAPGEAPVTVSATEARASEPVMTDEAALTKDTPPPATNPAPSAAAADGEVLVRETGDPGEPEHNAAAHAPSDDETTVDGIRYADVAHPSNPTERLEKREIELGAEMDYGEHRRTYAMFMNATKYGTVIVVALLIAMAVGFFTSGGVMGGLVMFLGAGLAAAWFLR